mgnify:CR=1 FL=1
MSSTVDTTDQSQPDRVCLNLRVSQSVKENYEAAITEKYGKKRPYTGTELEREMRLRLDTGKTFELYSSIQDLAEVYGKANREKKFFSTPSGDDTVILKYRVAEPIRRGIMSLAAERDKGAGEFVDTIMNQYARGEGVDERMCDLINRG